MKIFLDLICMNKNRQKIFMALGEIFIEEFSDQYIERTSIYLLNFYENIDIVITTISVNKSSIIILS